MERKHMSAFALYKTLSADQPPPAKKPSLQVSAKKKKKKSNGVVQNNNNNNNIQVKQTVSAKKRKLENTAAKSPAKLHKSEEEQLVGGGEECLDNLLKELSGVNNSRERASRLFQWLINPIPAKAFFRETWEKKPIIVQRKNPNYYEGLFSTAEFDRILRQEDVQYGVNLDVTSYAEGKRETHNPPGRALPYSVWDFYDSGCSLRMLNPQSFSSSVWSVLSILQEHFGSMAGANVYLTPPGTQGFAPHYDDIEAFIIQLEGKKHWRVYSPRSEDEVLPVTSSRFIHQGDCLPDAHSMHITISSYQKNSWGDLLLKMVPAALEIAMEEDVEYRQGLPLDYLTYMGVQNSDKDDPRRGKFLSHVEGLIKKLAQYAPVDAAVDLKARDFMYDCLPPNLTPAELGSSVQGAPARWHRGRTVDVGSFITAQTKIRLVRASCARLCSDGDVVSLYYTTNNSRVYHKEEIKSLEVNVENTDAIEFLIHSYPKFVTVASVPCDSADDRIALVESLFEKGIIHTEQPLKATSF
ncbi:hypothetical protein WMY93_016263 [Mugilogobius chulae]|uniref:Bifunctional lysine-specific demethylase and histidyl-hydroxylase n=1 Tax=Mugilogobius chulae TaxID=88201 RepID=A0AAW0P2M9_9GOBI